MLKNLRQKSPKLAFIVSFVIVLVTVSVTLMWSLDSKALEGSGPHYTAQISGDYQGPHCCRECHKNEFDAWSHSSHAQAVVDPIFQVNLQQAEQPNECFACHTTGYDEETGDVVVSGAPQSVDITMSESVSVENLDKNKINVYPNPASNMIYFSNQKEIQSLRIYSIQGQEVKLNMISKNSLNISELASGIYTIIITDIDGNIYRNKFVKM